MQDTTLIDAPSQLFTLFKKHPYPIRHNFTKRLFDIFFSLSVLAMGIILFPLFLTLAIIIKIQSKGPVFYIQDRISRGGRAYPHIKFRTMYADAEEKLNELLQKDSKLKEEWIKFCKLKNDPRVTPIGKFLRRTSLDELPQFWNVLRGDLSVVGPRPVCCEEVVKYFGASAPKILSIRPGITGLWQVSGRSDISVKDRVKLEERYVEKQSLFLDFLLICKTIPVMLFSRGAY